LAAIEASISVCRAIRASHQAAWINALVLDHSGAIFRHLFVEDPVGWTLDEDKRAESPALRRESVALKEVVAEQTLELRLLKKSMIAPFQ
jgi:hypothetical protein